MWGGGRLHPLLPSDRKHRKVTAAVFRLLRFGESSGSRGRWKLPPLPQPDSQGRVCPTRGGMGPRWVGTWRARVMEQHAAVRPPASPVAQPLLAVRRDVTSNDP